MRKLVVGVPRAGGPLVSVVELDVTEEPAVEAGGAEFGVRHDVGFTHASRQLLPRAPARGCHRLRQPVLIDRRGRDEQGAQRGQAVALRVERDPHPGGIALGAERPCREPLARRLQPLRSQLHAGLAGLSCIEGDRQAPARPGEPERRVTRQARRLRRAHGDHPAGVEGVIPVHEGDQRTRPAQHTRLRELEKADAFHAREEAIGKHGHGDDGLRGLGRAGREELRFHPDAGGAAAHHDGVAARRSAASDGAIFQVGEADRAVGQPGHDFRVADERNGSGVPVVPQ